MKKLNLRTFLSPGDMLMLTVALRSLHETYPKQFKTSVETYCPEVFRNNPFVSSFSSQEDVETIDVNYISTYKNKNKTGKHFSDGYIDCLNETLNLNIKKSTIFPDIFLTSEEKLKAQQILKREKIEKPFIVINAGFKNDMPLKQFPARRWNFIVEELLEEGIPIVQVGSKCHVHQELSEGVINLVGKTENLRDYFALVSESLCCMGAVSLQMHTAAAFRKPCIVLAGGRENPSWSQYPNHQFLHTVGVLDCCKYDGCWKKQFPECSYIKEGAAECMFLLDECYIVEIICKMFNK